MYGKNKFFWITLNFDEIRPNFFLVVVGYFLKVTEQPSKVEKNYSWFPTKFNVLFQNMKKKMFFDRN